MEVFACRLERRDIEKNGEKKKRKKEREIVFVKASDSRRKRKGKGLSAQANLAVEWLTNIMYDYE
jgi:hypothetical protein